MEFGKPIKELGCPEDSVKSVAVKYNVGKVRSEKYGEATISVHLLFLSDKEFPPIYVEEVKEKVDVWLDKMGLQKYKDEQLENDLNTPRLMAYTAAGTDPEKLEVYFLLNVFGVSIDNDMRKLVCLNENNPEKQQEDLLSVIENLLFIIENHGNNQATEAAASKLNPILKHSCFALSYLVKCCFEQMDEDDYKRYMRELSYFVRSFKWMQEYHILPYDEEEYLHVRIIDLIASPVLCAICIARGVRVSDEIRIHPVFQRYYKNLMVFTAKVNDILSVRKEIADSDNFNTILFGCRKYSLQESLYKAEKSVNDLIIALRKDQIRLQLYYPTNEGLKNFIETVEIVVDGTFRWYQAAGRYGNRNIETCMVEYRCNLNSWLEQMSTMHAEYLKEPRSKSDFDNCSVPSIFV